MYVVYQIIRDKANNFVKRCVVGCATTRHNAQDIIDQWLPEGEYVIVKE